MNERKELGPWLTGVMKEQRTTGRWLAHKMGVHESTVSNWRSGETVPSPEQCLQLGQIFRVDDPFRVLVTAGHISERWGRKPLPIQKVDHERDAVIKAIEKIPHLDDVTRFALLDEALAKYDEGAGS